MNGEVYVYSLAKPTWRYTGASTASIDSSTGTNLVGGAVNPVNGLYYFGGFTSKGSFKVYEYNAALASGALLAANSTVPTSRGTDGGGYDYEDMLATPSGVMARLRYDALGIDLPIYHGTSDETLLKGIGHLEGTSLPVGGEGNRSVLTAHRGLANSTLFTDLNQAELGDRFQIEVSGEVLTYEVIDYKVIEPEEAETLLAEPGRDLTTLVTCTPLGINSQRILVTGSRVTPTPAADLERAGSVPEIPGFPW